MPATTVRATIDTAFQKDNFLDFINDHDGRGATAMICDIEEGAFVVGTFMGAKLAGASAETLNLLRKHLVL
jgi:hypothetical protein